MFVSTVFKERRKSCVYPSVNEQDHRGKYTALILLGSLPNRKALTGDSMLFEPLNARSLSGRTTRVRTSSHSANHSLVSLLQDVKISPQTFTN